MYFHQKNASIYLQVLDPEKWLLGRKAIQWHRKKKCFLYQPLSWLVTYTCGWGHTSSYNTSYEPGSLMARVLTTEHCHGVQFLAVRCSNCIRDCPGSRDYKTVQKHLPTASCVLHWPFLGHSAGSTPSYLIPRQLQSFLIISFHSNNL